MEKVKEAVKKVVKKSVIEIAKSKISVFNLWLFAKKHRTITIEV